MLLALSSVLVLSQHIIEQYKTETETFCSVQFRRTHLGPAWSDGEAVRARNGMQNYGPWQGVDAR